MIHFECDYACGASASVLNALVRTNCEQTSGYSEDEHCDAARQLIMKACNAPDAHVHFVVGGTQANLTVIASAIRPFEGVLCAETGHINVHETGAIEATGHKVLGLPQKEGKITAQQVADAMEAHIHDSSFEHIVRPGMVYLSHPTELGTLYTRKELEDMAEVCRKYQLPLFIDGARLSYGLAAMPEVDLPFLASICDAFTIGGTKCGLLFGEAIVLTNEEMHRYFRYHIKQRGGMLAKGRLLGVQFEAVFEDGEYLSSGARANQMAQQIKNQFVKNGCGLFSDTLANQVFPIVPDAVCEKLSPKYRFTTWEKTDATRTAVRFCTNVTTDQAEVDMLLKDIDAAFVLP